MLKYQTGHLTGGRFLLSLLVSVGLVALVYSFAPHQGLMCIPIGLLCGLLGNLLCRIIL